MNRRHPRRGAALLLALGLLGILGMSAAALWAHLLRTQDAMRWESQRETALHLAEGGLDYALARLRSDAGFRGVAEQPLGLGRFSVSVMPQDGGVSLTSTGMVGEGPAPARVELEAYLVMAPDGAVRVWQQERVLR